jgi:hypothetical protein
VRLWRRLRGGHWERWYVDSPVNSSVWHRVAECTYGPGDAPGVLVEVGPRPTPLCRGTATCEDYLTWPERIDVWRGLGGELHRYEDVRAELGLGLEKALPPTDRPRALTWTCHFCGDERPDEFIGVRLVRRHLRGIGWAQVPITVSRRYCKDRALCWEAAKHWADGFTMAGSIEDADECP